MLLKCEEIAHLKDYKKVTLVERNNEVVPFFGDVATFSIYYLYKKDYSRFNVYGCDCNYIEDYNILNVDVERNNKDPSRRIVLKLVQDQKILIIL